VNGGDSLAESR